MSKKIAKYNLSKALLFLVIIFPASVLGGEGLWEPDSIPQKYLDQYNLNNEKIEKIKKVTLKLSNGGTGVFVTSDGLLITNQHVAKDFVQNIITKNKNYIKTGYLATSLENELKLTKIKISILVSQQDVTDIVNSGISADMPSYVKRNTQIENSRRLAETKNKENKLANEVLSTHGGQKHILYSYKVYDDVRLVFLPKENVAIFGGDKDNFEYPRYWFDVAFLRIYENNKPLNNKDYLPLASKGASDNDRLITAGFPISTERNLSAAHLKYLQQTELPLISDRIKTEIKSLNDYAQISDANRIEVQSQKFELENSLKAIEGRLKEMIKNDLAKKKMTSETKLLTKKKDVMDAFEKLANAYADLSKIEAERRFLDMAWAFDTAYFIPARMHIRWAEEKAKPIEERSRGYDDARLAQFENIIRTTVATPTPHEEDRLSNSLTMMLNTLGKEHPTVRQILGNKTPREKAIELLKSELKNKDFRNKLADQGLKGVSESDDPMIKVMKFADQRALELRSQQQRIFSQAINRYYPLVTETLIDSKGEDFYPDANFSLRFSFGKLKGYEDEKSKVKPFTNISGLFLKAKTNDYQVPYALPDNWKSATKLHKSKTPFNFVMTNDVSGGNSGSPVINTKGELVGIVFDSNMPALIWKYSFDESRGRSIAVDIRAVTEVLGFLDAEHILKNLASN